MNVMILRCSLLCLVVVTLLLSGCSNKETMVLVPVEGKLMMGGKPVPLARIEFMPEFKGHGAESNSFAVTDDNGHFVLANGVNPGAAVATHRVVINEGPPPAGTRGQDEASQTKMAEYTRSLKNRPLPTSYQLYSTTPLRLEITAEKRDLIIEMKR